MAEAAPPSDRHWRATDERYPKFDHGDEDCGCRRCVGNEAFRRGYARALADQEADLIAEIADWLDRLEKHAQKHVAEGHRKLSPASVAQGLREGDWREP